MDFGLGIKVQAFDVVYEFMIAPFNWKLAYHVHPGTDGGLCRRWIALGPFRLLYIDYAKMNKISA